MSEQEQQQLIDRSALAKAILADREGVPGLHRAGELKELKASYAKAADEATGFYLIRSNAREESAENRKQRMRLDVEKHRLGEKISAILREQQAIADEFTADANLVMDPRTDESVIKEIAARYP